MARHKFSATNQPKRRTGRKADKDAIKPLILNPQPPAVFAPLWATDKHYRYRGAWGGRYSGKSHNFAEMLVIKAATTIALKWACLRETQKSLAQSVKSLVEDKIQMFGVGHLFEIQHDKIITPGGGVIVFMGMQNHTADSIKSLNGFHGCWFEEAQSCSQHSLTLLRPTFREAGAELWFSWNPFKQDDPVDLFFRGEHQYPDAIMVKANYWDNPHCTEEMLQEIEFDKKHNYERYRWVWEGEYATVSEARIFNNWRIEEFDVPKEAVIRQGADWGFSIDPTVLVQCFIEGKKLYIPHEAYMVGCELDTIPNLFDTVPDARVWPITADSSRPETIAHLRKKGFPKIFPAIKGARSVEEGIEFMRSFEIIVHPRCVNTIKELNNYSYKIDPQTEQVIPVLEDKNNHVIDSLRYALEGARLHKKAGDRFAPVTIIPTKHYFAKRAA